MGFRPCEREEENDAWCFSSSSACADYLCMHEIYPQMRFDAFGKIPLCNERPETAPHIGNFCFPVCWRCFSAFIGAALITITVHIGWIRPPLSLYDFFIAVLLTVPCMCDGLLSYLTPYESSNKRRAITGMLAGIGLRTLVYWLIGS